MNGIELNPSIKPAANETIALAGTSPTNMAAGASNGSTNENSQIDTSALGIDLSSYDIKIQSAEKDIIKYKDDVAKYEAEVAKYEAEVKEYEKLIKEQEAIIKNLNEMIKDKQSERKEIQSKIDSLENNEENRSKIKGLQNQITGIDNNIADLTSYLNSANSTKAGYEKELKTAEKELKSAKKELDSAENHLNSAEASRDKAISERSIQEAKQKAAIAAKAEAEAAAQQQSSSFVGGAKNTGASSGGTSQNGINLIKQFEGCMLQAYRCPAGVATIGYGHTQGVSMGQSISGAQAEQLLKQDLAEFEGYVSQRAQKVGCKLTQSQFDALVSFTYNLGPGGLAESGIIEKIANGDIQGAKNTMLQYDHAGGQKLAGLTRRREAEAAML